MAGGTRAGWAEESLITLLAALKCLVPHTHLINAALITSEAAKRVYMLLMDVFKQTTTIVHYFLLLRKAFLTKPRGNWASNALIYN